MPCRYGDLTGRRGQIIAQGTHQQLSEHTPQYQQLLSALEDAA